jgi:hypothetical protein
VSAGTGARGGQVPAPSSEHAGNALAVVRRHREDGMHLATATLVAGPEETVHAASTGLAHRAHLLAGWHAAGGTLTGPVKVTVTVTLPATEPDES